MINVILLGLRYYIFFLLLIFFFLFVGNFIIVFLTFNKTKENKYLTLFFQFISGLIFTILIFSIIKSNFRTVNILFIVILIILILKYYKSIIWIKSKLFIESVVVLLKRFPLVIILAFPFYFFQAFFLLKSGHFNFVTPFIDYIWYNDISEILSKTGQENKELLTNLYFPEFNGINPYHYFELWINAFFIEITNIPGITCLMLFVYPLLYLLSLIGLLSIWEHFSKVNIYKIIICYLLFFIGGIYFDFFKNYELLKYSGYLHVNIFNVWNKKLAVLYPFIILSYLFFIQNKKDIGLIFLLFICIIALGSLPGIAGGIILILILNYWLKFLSKKEFKYVVISIIVFFFSYLTIFYICGNKNKENVADTAYINILLSSLQFSNLKYIIFKSVFPFIRVILFFSPFIAFICYVYIIELKNKDVKHFNILYLLVGIILVTGTITSGIAFKLYIGGEFFLWVMPLFWVLFNLSFIVYFRHLKLNKYNLPVFLFFISIFGYNLFLDIKNHYENKLTSSAKYSDQYLFTVKKILDNSRINNYGICFIGQNDIDKINGEKSGNPVSLNNKIICFARIFSNKYYGVSNLSILDMSLNKSNLCDNIWLSSYEFYHFVKLQKRNKIFTSIENSQLDFIDINKVDFAFIYPNAIVPQQFTKKIKYQLIDSVSGEKFVVLKK